MRIVIVGAGGHAQVICDILLQRQKYEPTLQPIGYMDDDESLYGHSLLGVPVMGNIKHLKNSEFDFDQVVIAIGSNQIRYQLAQELSTQSTPFATIIHPTAVIGSDVEIGHGSVICANAVINPGTRIGKHVIINTAATVDHHSQVGDFVHLAPGAHAGGEVSIKKGAFVGIGALVLPRQSIGAWATVGAGAVVNSKVLDNETVVGVPARPIRR